MTWYSETIRWPTTNPAGAGVSALDLSNKSVQSVGGSTMYELTSGPAGHVAATDGGTGACSGGPPRPVTDLRRAAAARRGPEARALLSAQRLRRRA